MKGTGTRIARNPETGKTYNVPSDMTYEEWKKKQDELYGEGFIDLERKKVYNEKADKKQYERYKEVLGKNAPTTFKDFQKIKYEGEWTFFYEYFKSIKRGELTTLSNFDLYKEIGLKIDSILVNKTTQNGIIITGKSYHFIARTIGSVFQRRSGVSVEDTLDAVLHPLTIDAVINNKNGQSQRFKGKSCFVTINPSTGVLIQVNPCKGVK